MMPMSGRSLVMAALWDTAGTVRGRRPELSVLVALRRGFLGWPAGPQVTTAAAALGQFARLPRPVVGIGVDQGAEPATALVVIDQQRLDEQRCRHREQRSQRAEDRGPEDQREECDGGADAGRIAGEPRLDQGL